MRVQLIYFEGCPNVDAARVTLRRCMDTAGVGAEIEEIDTAHPDAPDDLRGWGSPTILIDGRDVACEPMPNGSACRLYENPEHRSTPPAALILTALRAAQR